MLSLLWTPATAVGMRRAVAEVEVELEVEVVRGEEEQELEEAWR